MPVAGMWLSTLQLHFQDRSVGLALGCPVNTQRVPVPYLMVPCPKPLLPHNYTRLSAKQVNTNQSMFAPSQ